MVIHVHTHINLLSCIIILSLLGLFLRMYQNYKELQRELLTEVVQHDDSEIEITEFYREKKKQVVRMVS